MAGATAEKYGKWHRIELLGSGGQGTVCVARDFDADAMLARAQSSLVQAAKHTHLLEQRSVAASVRVLADAVAMYGARDDISHLGALKVLHHLEDAADREKAASRLGREQEALNKAAHPNLLRLLDAKPDEHWLVTEFHPLGSLDRHAERTRGDARAALRAIRPLVEAVARLHEQKPPVIHRDIKPVNILVADDGRLVLADLGIVAFQDPARTRLSEVNETVGSTDWMPLWAKKKKFDGETEPDFDVYSLGKLLWWMIRGDGTYLVREEWNEPAEDLTRTCASGSRAEGMDLVNEILARTVVSRQEQCLRDAGELLKRIDDAIADFDRGLRIVGDKLVGRCQVCGRGTYALFQPEQFGHGQGKERWEGGVRGLRLRHYECAECGHVVLFGTDSRAGETRAPWAGPSEMYNPW